MSLELENCFKDRKLRRIASSVIKAEKSLATAEQKLSLAKNYANSIWPDATLVFAYAAMFHAGRALLYCDGVQEKSHFCLVEYLKEEYVKKGKLEPAAVALMDSFREARHDILYGLEKVRIPAKDIEEALDAAEALIEAAKSIVSGKK